MNNHNYQQIKNLIISQDYIDAEHKCLQLLQQDVENNFIFQALIYIYQCTDRSKLATELLSHRFSEHSYDRQLCDQLANFYGKNNEFSLAADCYKRYLENKSEDAEAYYNYAFNLRHAGLFEKAIENYEKALQLNISKPEEVLVNIAVILSDHLREEEKAKFKLEKALTINSSYIPALINLANLYEQLGNKNNAEWYLNKVLSVEPEHPTALARLADIIQFSEVDHSHITKMVRALNQTNLKASERIDLYFALGKAFNDCQSYEQAFGFYEKANNLATLENPKFNTEEFAMKIEQIIAMFNKESVANYQTKLDYQPVFICGMFRSGSTLIEQIIGCHPGISVGGELDFFVRKVDLELSPFPIKVKELGNSDYLGLAQEYIKYVKKRFDSSGLITDKRSDNFLYLGLILTMFPNAKIIFTERNPLDNCLSVYFQRLGKAMNYATDLAHTAFYYKQHKKLMEHWISLYPKAIYTLNYDELIKEPKMKIESVLSFLGLDWSDECLNFHQKEGSVKTASVWQVRQPLYSGSSGRWQNFQKQLAPILNYFDIQKEN